VDVSDAHILFAVLIFHSLLQILSWRSRLGFRIFHAVIHRIWGELSCHVWQLLWLLKHSNSRFRSICWSPFHVILFVFWNTLTVLFESAVCISCPVLVCPHCGYLLFSIFAVLHVAFIQYTTPHTTHCNI